MVAAGDRLERGRRSDAGSADSGPQSVRWMRGDSCFSRDGMRCWGEFGDATHSIFDFIALGLGVPPLPLWAHGEPAEMPAPHFFSPGTRSRPATGTPFARGEERQ
jgi:hypothetical protein